MEFGNKIFVDPKKKLDQDVDVVFVADMFAEHYAGGAELTSEVLISESPLKVQKILAKDVDLALLSQGMKKTWIFGNFSQLNPELIPSIVANLKYGILEYDYKYCRFRSPEKHALAEGKPCNCHDEMNGKIVSAFFHGARMLWWMSEKQRDTYRRLFPFLSEKQDIVLSSVFSKNTLASISSLRDRYKDSPKDTWLILQSNSWVKGSEESVKSCEVKGRKYERVGNLPYDQFLEKLAQSKGLACHPPGGDTCPRVVIEAKLLGCELDLNDNVQHKDEAWFATDDLQAITDYLLAAPRLFWKSVENFSKRTVKISGYTTTYNCINQKYPFEQCIRSMLQFCDEVCVVDGGSTDGTYERISSIAEEFDLEGQERVKMKIVPRDWDHPRFAVFDGMQKAEARKMCTGDFCWQMDSDEVVHEDDASKIRDLCLKLHQSIEVVSLPVVEYWGGLDKVRVDVQPWKWRLSRNLPHITHGIPVDLRKTDAEGRACAHPGTDGCDMIHATTGERVPHVTFHTAESENARRHAAAGNPDALRDYQQFMNEVVENIPGVYHYSWLDIERKIRTYRDYWTKHWNSLYDGDMRDTGATNMFFDVPWSQVTEEMISQKAKELASKTGGWIWHRKWDGSKTPHIVLKRSGPASMDSWCKK